jgi:hypothetical protein
VGLERLRPELSDRTRPRGLLGGVGSAPRPPKPEQSWIEPIEDCAIMARRSTSFKMIYPGTAFDVNCIAQGKPPTPVRKLIIFRTKPFCIMQAN